MTVQPEKVTRALGNNRSAQEIMDGYRIWYYFILPNIALKS